MNSHLTENEFYDLLEAGDDRTHQHLATCKPCQAELDSVRAALTNFRSAATSLSLVHAPYRSTTRLLEISATRTRFFTLPRASWATGLVAAAVTVIGLVWFVQRVWAVHSGTQLS